MTATARQAAQPGLTWKRHYRPGEFAPQHPLPSQPYHGPAYFPVPARPGLTWRRHFRTAEVRPMHLTNPVPAAEGIQGFDIAPIYHMMAG